MEETRSLQLSRECGDGSGSGGVKTRDHPTFPIAERA
jgi:hypothetical protein